MKIRDLINKYFSNGCSFRIAKNLTAEEILLTRISSSSLVEHVTLKDKRFKKVASKPYNKWLDDEYDLIASTITDFINRL